MSDSLHSKGKSGEISGITNTVSLIGKKERIYIGEYHGHRTYGGLREGYAWTVLPNSDLYIGNYENGMRQGKGLYVFKDGSRYNGMWKNKNKHGMGQMIYPDGSYYEGEWKDNERHGFGTYHYINGDIHKGTWRYGKWHGLGSYLYHQLNVTVKAVWCDGIQDGPGKIQYTSFTFYGTWLDGICQGKGTYIFYDKWIQEGVNAVEKEESLKAIEMQSGSQNPEPDVPMSPTTTSLQNDTNIEQSVVTMEESKPIPKVKWSPLTIFMYNVNIIPIEPIYSSEEIISSLEQQNKILSTILNENAERDELEEEESRADSKMTPVNDP